MTEFKPKFNNNKFNNNTSGSESERRKNAISKQNKNAKISRRPSNQKSYADLVINRYHINPRDY